VRSDDHITSSDISVSRSHGSWAGGSNMGSKSLYWYPLRYTVHFLVHTRLSGGRVGVGQHTFAHFRLCGGRAAHFCTLSTFRGQGSCHQCSSMQQTLCFVSSTLYECRPLRSWKVPSSVSDCADGGLGISLPRSARVVAMTRPAPLLPKHPHRT
jgi:hypothetical protein